jgi:outer membrane protein assembly factor BamB
LSCCAVADGKLLWSRNFPAEFGRVQELPGGRARVNREESVIVPIGNGQGAPVPLFGYTGSLLPVDELLVCSVGGQRGGTIMAFDRATGKEVWRALDENVSYSSPVIADLAGVRQIVVMTGPRVVGLEPRSGKLLWSYPFQLQYDESISTPVVTDNLVIVGGTGMALTAVAVERRGNSFEARRKWENFDLCSYLSSMIAVGDTLFGMNDGGEFNAVSLVDGKTLWNGGRHGYYSTPVRDGNRLLCLNERAVLGVISAERDQFVQLGRSPLSQADSWTSPAVVEGRIYVRDSSAVRCFEPGR